MMNHSHIARPTLYDPAAAGAAARKWPLKRSFLLAVTMSITLWAGIIFTLWHLI